MVGLHAAETQRAKYNHRTTIITAITSHGFFLCRDILTRGRSICVLLFLTLKLASQEPGTLLWQYQTADWVFSSPAIADDGTVYFGSVDGYLMH